MKIQFLLFSFLVICTSFTNSKKVRYDGYKVLRLTPQTKEHVKLLEKLKRVKGVVFWKGQSANIGIESDIMIPPNLEPDLIQAVDDSGIQREQYIENVQTLIEAEGNSVTDKGTRLNWQQYAELDTIYQFLEEQATLHPSDVTLLNIGKSFEGRDLKVLKISKGSTPKPGIWLDSNIHAREWISGAVLTFMINEILNGQNLEIKSWANDFDFYFLPIVNPDGFQYSHTVDRIWRKTRSTQSSSFCRGVDANRNFGFKWQTGGSSNDPCDETYAGPVAFSEPETLAIAQYYTNIAPVLVGFISLHSYGQLILLPHGVRDISFPERDDQLQIALKIRQAIYQREGTVYRAGSIAEILYPASGGSIDWVKAIHKTNLTFVFELRDTGRHGFLLPARQIIPTSHEFLDGFQVIVDELRKTGKSTRKPILKLKTPLFPIMLNNPTFGALPSKNQPVIPGFRRF